MSAPTPDLRVRAKLFVMRVNEEERERFREIALRRGMALSVLICELLEREADRLGMMVRKT